MALTHDDVDKGMLPFEDSNTSYLQYLEAAGGAMCSTLSTEGLELQAAYLLKMGENQHPFDVLRRISINPFAQPKDRISASKSLLEYMARKIPASVEITGQSGGAVKLDTDSLKKLSGAELDVLSALLAKTGA